MDDTAKDNTTVLFYVPFSLYPYVYVLLCFLFLKNHCLLMLVWPRQITTVSHLHNFIAALLIQIAPTLMCCKWTILFCGCCSIIYVSCNQGRQKKHKSWYCPRNSCFFWFLHLSVARQLGKKMIITQATDILTAEDDTFKDLFERPREKIEQKKKVW